MEQVRSRWSRCLVTAAAITLLFDPSADNNRIDQTQRANNRRFRMHSESGGFMLVSILITILGFY